MSKKREEFSIPEGLLVADPVAFQYKVAQFTKTMATDTHVIFDFDRTLTVKKPGTQDEVTTWHILREHLPGDGQLAYQKLFEKYRALELSGKMTQEDAVAWWSSILDLFVRHKVNLGAVEETFLERATMRPGTAELFEFLATKGIPTIILSAGIREVIEIWCRKYAITPSLILSTSLVLDGSSVICGWQKDTLIHALNKSEANHPELSAIRANRPKVLLVGDSLDDAAMAMGTDDVIRIRVLDPRADENPDDEEMRKTFEKFDGIIKNRTLYPLLETIQLFAPDR